MRRNAGWLNGELAVLGPFYWGDKTRRRASLSSSEVVSPEAESHAQLNVLEFGVPEASTFWYMQLLES
jgi:hypothetical protein